jgi:hypothetical protein
MHCTAQQFRLAARLCFYAEIVLRDEVEAQGGRTEKHFSATKKKANRTR